LSLRRDDFKRVAPVIAKVLLIAEQANPEWVRGGFTSSDRFLSGISGSA
jgi:hypothetical protein